jgi:hypothetical protein
MLLKSLSGYWMKVITLSTALLLICISSDCQNLIGYKAKDIVKYMKENHKEMNYNDVVNNKFSYLKYSDNLDNQTILFFLGTDSVCKSERIVCDKSLKTAKVKEYNSQYIPKGENKWVDRRDGKMYTIELLDGKWSCVVSFESEK